MKYHRIDTCDVTNGRGIRTVLWVQGCSLKCKGCYSKQTWNFNTGHEFTKETEDYIISTLQNPYVRGLTISGGNPTENLDDGCLLKLVKRIRRELPEKDIYCWSGNTFEELIVNPVAKEFLSYIDMLRDGRFEEDKLDLRQYLQGSSNQRYVDCKESIKQGKFVGYKF